MPDGREKQATIMLPFPVGGLYRRAGYQAQPARTTPDCVNVRPLDTLDGRERGGSRPGLVVGFDPGVHSPVQALRNVSYWSSGTLVERVMGVAGGIPFLADVYDGALVTSSVAVSGSSLGATTGHVGHAQIGSTVYLADGVTLKTLDVSTGVVAVAASAAGTVPTGCSLACMYGGRLVLAGGNVVYFSRLGAPLNFDFHWTLSNPTDRGNAIAETTATEPFAFGPEATALIPLGDRLVVACENEMHAVAGPAIGGTRLLLSRGLGVIGPRAWCQLPDGSVMFLSRAGLAVLPRQGVPELLSRSVLPSEFLDVVDTVSMAYDVAEHGVHIAITPDEGQGTHWFLDLDTKGFFPDQFASEHWHFTDVMSVNLTLDGRSRVLLGGRDGVVRWYDSDAADDCGTAFDSYVVYGPVRASGDLFVDSMAREMVAVTDASSAAVTWTVLSGATGEEVVDSPGELATGTFKVGRSHVAFPRVRSGDVAIKLSASAAWAVELLAVLSHVVGRQR